MPDAIVDYTQKVFNLDEYRARAIVQLYRDQWEQFGEEIVDPWIKARYLRNYLRNPPWIQPALSPILQSMRPPLRKIGVPEPIPVPIYPQQTDPYAYPNRPEMYEQPVQSTPESPRFRFLGNELGQRLTREILNLPEYYTGIPQTIPQGWNPETLRNMASSQQYTGQYIPGGALAASAWGSTPQSSGLSPGGWIAQRKAGGSSGQWGG